MSSWIKPIDFNASLNNGIAEGGYAGTAIPVAMGGTAQTTLQTATSASKIMATDANANLSVNNLLQGYTLTVSSTTAVQMTAASTYFQLINGTAAQPFWLPDVSTIPVGTTYIFIIQTSGNVTLLTFGGAALLLNPMFNGCKYYATSLLTSGTTSASWVWGLESSNSQYIPILGGGTGAGTKANAFNALSPMTTGGDMIYGGASGAGTRLANGTAGQVLTSNGTTVAPTWNTVTGTGTVTSVAATVPTFLSVAGTPITGAGTLAITLSGTALPVANGGTGQTSASAAFNALSPMTTGGDLIYGGTSGAGTRLANGTAGQVLTSNGTTVAPTWATPASGVTSVAQTVPSFLSIAGSPITTTGSLDISYSGTALPVANGGTGQTTATTAFNALSPMTTGGDLIYGGASGAGTRLAAGSSGQILKSNGTSAPAWLTTLPIANGGTGVTSVTTAKTASAWAGWDSNACMQGQAFVGASALVTAGTTYTAATLPAVVYCQLASNGTITLPAAQNGRLCSITNGSSTTLVTVTDGTFSTLLYNQQTINLSGVNGYWIYNYAANNVASSTFLPCGFGNSCFNPQLNLTNTTYTMDNTWPTIIVPNFTSAGISAGTTVTFKLPASGTIAGGTTYYFATANTGNNMFIQTSTGTTFMQLGPSYGSSTVIITYLNDPTAQWVATVGTNTIINA